MGKFESIFKNKTKLQRKETICKMFSRRETIKTEKESRKPVEPIQPCGTKMLNSEYREVQRFQLFDKSKECEETGNFIVDLLRALKRNSLKRIRVVITTKSSPEVYCSPVHEAVFVAREYLDIEDKAQKKRMVCDAITAMRQNVILHYTAISPMTSKYSHLSTRLSI